ncbi:hypothetical protein PCE1_001713 [Barthelona sp. PCE]
MISRSVTQNYSSLQLQRMNAPTPLPKVLENNVHFNTVSVETKTPPASDEVLNFFPHIRDSKSIELLPTEESTPTQMKVGLVLSGGQASGGHNVIVGLFDYLKKLNADNQVFAFLKGPGGLLKQDFMELDAEYVNQFRNSGGFHLACSDRTKIHSEEQFQAAMDSMKALDLDYLLVIGGDDSNTNACLLAERFAAENMKTKVIGAPKTIDGDLRSAEIETSFGFDTACRVYSELIGNIMMDCLSAQKYWHFIRLMGRSASHIAIECALQTQPNAVIIGEEVAEKKMTLDQVVNYLADVIIERNNTGRSYGVALIPEGLIEFIPEMGELISELNDKLAEEDITDSNVREALSAKNVALLDSLPATIQNQLLLDRDPHGNVQVSLIETEKLLINMLIPVLKEKGMKLKAQTHFFGYEGRCALPTLFDSSYCYALGQTAGALMANGCNGYMARVWNTHLPVADWRIGGLPLAQMMGMERRHGHMVPVITKALVELDGPVFAKLEQVRESWIVNDMYRSPGPIQFYGDIEPSYNVMLNAEE